MIAVGKKNSKTKDRYCLLSALHPRNVLIRASRVSFIKSQMMNRKLLYFIPEATGKWTQIDFGEDAK